MRNDTGNYQPDHESRNYNNFHLNLNKNFTNMLSGIISRTHLLMLSTFSYAQNVRVYGSNGVFDSLCRQYFSLSNSVQGLIGQINDSGIETTHIYNNLTRLSEIDNSRENDETFSEVTILNALIDSHQILINYIDENFNITTSKMSSEACAIIFERLKDHRHMIRELLRVKNELEKSLVFKSQLN
jgi:hypothetical protein